MEKVKRTPIVSNHNVKDSLKLFVDFCNNSITAHDVDPALEYMNYMVDRMEMNDEQVLWLCFLYGLTYQLPTAYVIWNEFPDLELVDEDRLTKWFTKNKSRLPFQQDKVKCKKDMVRTILSYQSVVNGSQKQYFDTLLNSDNPQVNFDRMWSPLKSVYAFGRFSTWNQCQALKHVAGYNVEPTTLMLGESDSISFTDGLAYAYGLTEKVTQRIIDVTTGKKKKVYYKWSNDEKLDMEKSCAVLKKSLGIDNFQLETLACAFKKIWRTNDSRYVGYYNDRIADDIRKTSEQGWDGVDWQLLWDAREECVPKKYLHNNIGVNRDCFLLTPEEKIYL